MIFFDGITMLVVFIFGLVVGSFLNVIIYRLPVMMEREARLQSKLYLGIEPTVDDKATFNIAYPPSRCPHCHAAIKPWSNIPVLSFLWQKGRCRACLAPISWRYPAIELLTAGLFLFVYIHFGISWQMLAALCFCALAVPLFFIDADTQLLPDVLTLLLLWLGLIANSLQLFTTPQDAIMAAAAGYMVFWVIFQLFKLITGKEGMGYGDFKLLAALGAWFGIASLPIIILLSSVVGIVVSVLVLRLTRGKATPFGPYLIFAGWVMLMFQNEVQAFMQWWLRLSGLN